MSGVAGGCADLHWLPVRLPWLHQIYKWGGNLRDYENVAIYYFDLLLENLGPIAPRGANKHILPVAPRTIFTSMFSILS